MFRWAQGIAVKNPSHQARGTGPASRLAGPAGGSIGKTVLQIGSTQPRSAKTATLIKVALVTSSTNAPEPRAARNPDLSVARTDVLYNSPVSAHAALLYQYGSNGLPPGLPIQSATLRQAHPRAPPIQAAVPKWNRVGTAYLT